MRFTLTSIIFLLITYSSYSQVGIGTTTPNARLEISIENTGNPASTDGILIPRLNNLPSLNPTDSQHGMLIFLASASGDSNPGFHYWDKNKGTAGEWIPMGENWNLTGNDNATKGIHFIGTKNANEIEFRVNDKHISQFTEQGQFELTADEKSVFIGFQAGDNYDPVGTGAEQNVYIGYGAGMEGTSAANNVAIGTFSLSTNTTGNDNVSIGDETLENNTTGYSNSGAGNDVLRLNTTGFENSVIGRGAMHANRSGFNNTAAGRNALRRNNRGDYNSAVGGDAGADVINGANNTFIGDGADVSNANFTNAMAIGNEAIAGRSNEIIFGNTLITEIGGYAGWSNISDERFKYNIQDNVPGLEFITQLRTVTYKLDHKKLIKFKGETANIENSDDIHTGFLAQQVEQVANQLGYEFNGVSRPDDLNSQHYTVTYSEFVVPLVKAIQEQQSQIDADQGEIDKLRIAVNKLINSN